MDYETLKVLVEDEKLSARAIARKYNLSPSKVFRLIFKYNLKLARGIGGSLKNEEIPRVCIYCSTSGRDNFYNAPRNVCKKCMSNISSKRKKDTAFRAKTHLGGKCSKCGYDKCIDALDIHHTNPSIKDPNFRTYKGWTWDRVKLELESCVLLCKNCHTEFHSLV